MSEQAAERKLNGDLWCNVQLTPTGVEANRLMMIMTMTMMMTMLACLLGLAYYHIDNMAFVYRTNQISL